MATQQKPLGIYKGCRNRSTSTRRRAVGGFGYYKNDTQEGVEGITDAKMRFRRGKKANTRSVAVIFRRILTFNKGISDVWRLA